MEAGAAVLEVVIVVGDQMAVDAGLPQEVGQVVVEGLERAPGAVQEVQPPVCMSRRAGMQGMLPTKCRSKVTLRSASRSKLGVATSPPP